MRPLFSNAPILQAAPRMPQQPVGSQLAAALSGGRPPLYLPPANFGSGIPLASMMQAMNKQGNGVTSSTPNLVWNPNNPVGTDTLGGNTANQGSWLGNAAATYLPGYQGGPPSPATTPSGAYQPTSSDQGLMASVNQAGALAPQYQQQMQAPGASPNAPTPGGPGPLGMLGQMFGGMFSGGGMAGAGGMGGGGG